MITLMNTTRQAHKMYLYLPDSPQSFTACGAAFFQAYTPWPIRAHASLKVSCS